VAQKEDVTVGTIADISSWQIQCTISSYLCGLMIKRMVS